MGLVVLPKGERRFPNFHLADFGVLTKPLGGPKAKDYLGKPPNERFGEFTKPKRTGLHYALETAPFTTLDRCCRSSRLLQVASAVDTGMK